MMQGCIQQADVVIVGAGPAGLAAAVAARAAGAGRVVVLERQSFPGGVLPQCVHDGFGLHVHGQALTGPEYAHLWAKRAEEAGAQISCDVTVLSVGAPDTPDAFFAVDAVGAVLGGRVTIQARSVVVATGCRERARGQLGIAGTRPPGVMTAGCAQYLMNRDDLLPGDSAVILGTGDIGLIMARRLTLEGAKVKLVLGAEPTGLLRNHVQCIKDWGIPLRLGWGIISVHGTDQLCGITAAPLCEDGTLDASRKEYIRCNLLLLACGLIPEREVMAGCADAPGLFVCGNADVPHDVVDQVTQDGLKAGLAAAAFATGTGEQRLDVDCLPDDVARMMAQPIKEAKAADAASVQMIMEEPTDTVVCTSCPVGCVIRRDESGVICGYGCLQGKRFAEDELTCPMRMFTSTVRTEGHPEMRLLPVRTSIKIPRARMMAVAKECRRISVRGSIEMGEVVRVNVANTGADLVACAPLERL